MKREHHDDGADGSPAWRSASANTASTCSRTPSASLRAKTPSPTSSASSRPTRSSVRRHARRCRGVPRCSATRAGVSGSSRSASRAGAATMRSQVGSRRCSSRSRPPARSSTRDKAPAGGRRRPRPPPRATSPGARRAACRAGGGSTARTRRRRPVRGLDRQADLGVQAQRAVGEVGRAHAEETVVDDQQLAVDVDRHRRCRRRPGPRGRGSARARRRRDAAAG